MPGDMWEGPWLFETPHVRLDCVRFVEGRAPMMLVRDDLLHPFAGGNKLRKLDGYLPRLAEAGVTDVVTCGGMQSSHATAVACLSAELGMRAHLLLRGPAPEIPTGYTVLSELFAHACHYVSRETYADRRGLFADYEGKKGYAVIPEGGTHPFALLGVMRLVKALAAILEGPCHLVIDAGTGTTAAGLALGMAHLGLDWQVEAVCLMRDQVEVYQRGAELLWSRAAELWGGPEREPVVRWCERQRKRRFGKVYAGELERCVSLARSTGVSVDPIYTLAAIEHLEAMGDEALERAVWVHTGGVLNILGCVQRFGPGCLR